MITLYKHNEEDGPSEVFFQLIALLFSAGEYEKILALNEKLPSFQLNEKALAEYYFVSARCCIQLNDLRRLTQNISHLQSSDKLTENVSFLNAEWAFFSNDMKTALQEINKIDFKDDELKGIGVLYQWRNSLLNGVTLASGEISDT